MTHLHATLVGVLAVCSGSLGVWCGTLAQDPPPAAQGPPPAPQPQPRPLALPPAEVLRRDDLLQRFPEDNPLLGTWRLVRVVRPNAMPPLSLTGYVIFTRSHMSLHLSVTGAGARYPTIQSTLRRYRIQDRWLWTQSQLGFRNDTSGRILLDAEGLQAKRAFVLLGNTLRLHQDDSSYHEYQRIE